VNAAHCAAVETPSEPRASDIVVTVVNEEGRRAAKRAQPSIGFGRREAAAARAALLTATDESTRSDPQTLIHAEPKHRRPLPD